MNVVHDKDSWEVAVWWAPRTERTTKEEIYRKAAEEATQGVLTRLERENPWIGIKILSLQEFVRVQVARNLARQYPIFVGYLDIRLEEGVLSNREYNRWRDARILVKTQKYDERSKKLWQILNDMDDIDFLNWDVRSRDFVSKIKKIFEKTWFRTYTSIETLLKNMYKRNPKRTNGFEQIFVEKVRTFYPRQQEYNESLLADKRIQLQYQEYVRNQKQRLWSQLFITDHARIQRFLDSLDEIHEELSPQNRDNFNSGDFFLDFYTSLRWKLDESNAKIATLKQQLPSRYELEAMIYWHNIRMSERYAPSMPPRDDAIFLLQWEKTFDDIQRDPITHIQYRKYLHDYENTTRETRREME